MSDTTGSWSKQGNMNKSIIAVSALYTMVHSTISTNEVLVSVSYNDSYDTGNNTNSSLYDEFDDAFAPPYTILQMVAIAFIAAVLSILTVIGNIMVMISFKMDKQLQTISNYFLLSLAVADFSIGLISMPLFTLYLLMGYWPLGDFLCDTWLAFDYLNSNASVLNLLIISFDRYFSVTRPLTYRALRNTKRAAFMIASAWVISLLLWPPWIYSWPYIEGARTVKKNQCYIQFLETNSYVTFGTALAAFYVPVTVMIFLYWRIWCETMQRQRDLTHLQAGKKEDSRKSTSSDDPPEAETYPRPENNRRTRNNSRVLAETLETTYVPTSLCVETLKYLPKTKKSKHWKISETLMSFCRADRDDDLPEDDESSHASPATTPASLETPMQSCSRTGSMSFRVDHLVQVHPPQSLALPSTSQKANDRAIPMTERNGPRKPDSKILESRHHTSRISLPSVSETAVVTPSPSLSSPSQVLKNTSAPVSSEVKSSPPTPPPQPISTLPSSTQAAVAPSMYSADSFYTILIRLPKDPSSTEEEEDCQASVKMYEGKEHLEVNNIETLEDSETIETSLPSNIEGTRCSKLMKSVDPPTENVRLPLNTKLVHKQVVKHRAPKKKRKQQERKQDMKAAKTLSAILLAFILTWTPYNVLVLWKTLSHCKEDDCIPNWLWNMSYYLCYLNSTVNPLCYALGNANFRRTYMRIFKCKWYNKRQHAAHRGYFS